MDQSTILKRKRSILGKTADFITFPIRALFMATEGRFGLSSLRGERMQIVATHCKGKVLDVGCGPGNLFIKQYIGDSNGLGIDIFQYSGVENVVDDMTNLPFEDGSFDTITLIAVGGHIPRSSRSAEFREICRLLKPDGTLLMTEGEPITQYLAHKWSHLYNALRGELDMDEERGMKEDEEYCMPRKELLSYLNNPPLKLTRRLRFMWGLNNLYIARKIPHDNERG